VHSLLGLTIPFAPISSNFTPFELKHALELSKCTRLFIRDRLLPVVLPLAKNVGIPSSKIYILGGSAKGRKSFSEMINDARTMCIPSVSARPATKNTLAYLMFSSGTTGLPKGLCITQLPAIHISIIGIAIMLSHGNIVHSIMQIVVVSQAVAKVYTVSSMATCSVGGLMIHSQPPPPNTPEGIPVWLAFLPLHHSYGLQYYAFRAFLQPCTLVLTQWDIEVVLQVIPK
jgi:acyl-CoA synthetase (AMP-forming)/AMP-acid ligase II